MAHLSDFSHRRQAQNERLLSELVRRILDVQPGDAYHAAGLEWSVASIGWHQFADVNPSSINVQYNSLVKRLGVHAQFDKQTMLERLLGALQKQSLQQDTLEARHSILSTIIHLSGQPLQKGYVPSATALVRLQEVPTGERPDDSCSQASDLSQWEEPGCSSAGSALSEWGDSESEADVPQEPSLQVPTPEPGNDTRAGKLSKMAEMLRLGQLDTRAKSDKPQSTSSEELGHRGDCLLERVLRLRAQDSSAQLPHSELCFSESSLVFQILHMLRGCPSPGTAFHLSVAKDAFEVAAGLHVPHLSPACLRNVLLRWVRIGTTAFRLRVFSEAVRKAALSAGSDISRSPIAPSATLAAYATAFVAELSLVERSIIQLQNHFAAHACSGLEEGTDVNLAALEATSQGILRHIRVLECVAGGVRFADQGMETAAQQGVSVLNSLHGLLSSASEDSTPQGRQHTAILMRLFLASLRPMVDSLQLWAEEGLVVDHLSEALVCQGVRDPQSPGFWSGAFHLRRDEKGLLLCPELLQAVAGDAFEAGKASLLLHSEHGSGTALPSACSRGRSLHAEMLRRLEQQIHVEAQRPGHGNTIADRMAASSSSASAWLLKPASLTAGASAACHEDPASSALQISPQASDLLQPNSLRMPSLGAASLQQPGAQWRLDMFLCSDSATPEAPLSSQLVSEHVSECPSAWLQGQQSEHHSCSSQQENQVSEMRYDRPGRELASSDSCMQPSSTSVLGDISNLVPSTSPGMHAAKPAARALPSAKAAERCKSQDEGSTSPPPPAAEATADSKATQHGLTQADQPLQDWFQRTMKGICSAHPSLAGRSEDRSQAQDQAIGQGRLHSVLVTAYTGKPQQHGCSVGRPVQEMWGAQWTAYAEDAADHGTLQVLSHADLSPVQALLDACILAPLQEMAAQRRRALMHQLTGPWGLQQHLDAVWKTFFLASPAIQPFLGTVHALLTASDRDGTQLRALDLQRALDAALSDAEHGSLLPSSCVTVRQDDAGGERSGLAALGALRLDIAARWPLPLVLQDVDLQQYNAVFAVLLQVRVASKALNGVRNRRDRGMDRAGCLAMSMRHFLGAYLAHVMGHLVHTCVPQLQQAVAAAGSLKEVHAAHETFLSDASGVAFTSSQQTTKLLKAALCRLLSLVWEFALTAPSDEAQKAGPGDAIAKTEELHRLWEAWQERYGFFQRLVKGCAARAPPSSGLKELAASMLPGQSANSP